MRERPERPYRQRPLADRFWEKVEIKGENDCWIWKGCISKGGTGYGNMYGGRGKFIKAHRVSWELNNKQIVPKGLLIRHTCDVGRCVNPNHLLLGTHKDNSDDKIKRNRGVFFKGSQQSQSKLDERKVVTIKLMILAGMRPTEIARKFSVGSTIIYDIRSNKFWTHVLWPEVFSHD